MDEFDDKLNKIYDRITSQELLDNSGLGNEIGFYVFDYPPEKELQVRDHITFVIDRIKKKNSHLRVNHVNLFELIINYLKNRNLLDRALKIDKEKGEEALLKALKAPLGAEKVAREFALESDPKNSDIILMSGVGSAWPLLRSHNLLNNLQPLMGSTPLVMFYPGFFTGQGLCLFGKLKESNYYRAFSLVT